VEHPGPTIATPRKTAAATQPPKICVSFRCRNTLAAQLKRHPLRGNAEILFALSLLTKDGEVLRDFYPKRTDLLVNRADFGAQSGAPLIERLHF
jgi:hypothetical protein